MMRLRYVAIKSVSPRCAAMMLICAHLGARPADHASSAATIPSVSCRSATLAMTVTSPSSCSARLPSHSVPHFLLIVISNTLFEAAVYHLIVTFGPLSEAAVYHLVEYGTHHVAKEAVGQYYFSKICVIRICYQY